MSELSPSSLFDCCFDFLDARLFLAFPERQRWRFKGEVSFFFLGLYLLYISSGTKYAFAPLIYNRSVYIRLPYPYHNILLFLRSAVSDCFAVFLFLFFSFPDGHDE